MAIDFYLKGARIVIQRGSVDACGQLIADMSHSAQVAVVTAPPIRRRYGSRLVLSLKRAGCDVKIITVPDGERVKSLRWVSFLYDHLLLANCERSTVLVALGGGVIGDLTGFVASTYLRGVRYIQFPTTLVAQVDASIGGKTAVNHPKGKNLIGTFYQPQLVVSDVSVLQTLPKRHVIGGLAEVVKYGMIADPKLFAFLEQHAATLPACPLDAMEEIVRRSARIKADVVNQDEREAGLRRILNYGHSLGHAIEMATGYGRYHHGEAIAIGMQFAATLAARRDMVDPVLVARQGRLLTALGLPTRLPPRINHRRLLTAMTHDKKVQRGELQMVLPTKVGQVTVEPVSARELSATLDFFAAP